MIEETRTLFYILFFYFRPTRLVNLLSGQGTPEPNLWYTPQWILAGAQFSRQKRAEKLWTPFHQCKSHTSAHLSDACLNIYMSNKYQQYWYLWKYYIEKDNNIIKYLNAGWYELWESIIILLMYQADMYVGGKKAPNTVIQASVI